MATSMVTMVTVVTMVIEYVLCYVLHQLSVLTQSGNVKEWQKV